MKEFIIFEVEYLNMNFVVWCLLGDMIIFFIVEKKNNININS